MVIRIANTSDHDQIWDIYRNVVSAGDTYAFPPDANKGDLSTYWFTPSMKTYVADEGGKILGTYFMKPNQPGLGAHIANCGYMVSPEARNRGIGKLLCKHSLEEAKAMGFKGMQFNYVVSTNKVAIALWEKLGFRIIGTTPGGFRHSRLGFVDTHIMYKAL